MDKKQLKDCYELWKHCFSDHDEYMNYYFEEKTIDNQVLTLYEGDKLTSMLHLNPFMMKLNGLSVHANYIVGVATHSDYRKQGRMRILLHQAFTDMYKKEQGFTYLMPAHEKIYTPFDFRFIYAQDRMKINCLGSEVSYQLKAAELDEDLTIDTLANLNEQIKVKLSSYVNEKLQEQFDLFAIRSEYYYTRLQKEMVAAGGDVLVCLRKNHIIGVVSFMMEGRKIEVTESVIEREETQNVISNVLSWIRNNKDENFEVEFLETNFIDLEQVREDLPITEEYKKPIIMARIIHLETFVKSFATKECMTKIIKVEDDMIEENQGVWKLDFTPNGCQIAQTTENPESSMKIYEVMEYFLKDKHVYINEIV